jgi:hypothetical protein
MVAGGRACKRKREEIVMMNTVERIVIVNNGVYVNVVMEDNMGEILVDKTVRANKKLMLRMTMNEYYGFPEDAGYENEEVERELNSYMDIVDKESIAELCEMTVDEFTERFMDMETRSYRLDENGYIIPKEEASMLIYAIYERKH